MTPLDPSKGTNPDDLCPSPQDTTKKNPYKMPEDFKTEREYGDYVKATIKPQMKVRALCNYEAITEGDTGTYLQTNDGSPPAQFSWKAMAGDTYWVFWHMVAFLPADNDDSDKEDAEEGEGENSCCCAGVTGELLKIDSVHSSKVIFHFFHTVLYACH